MKADTSSDTDSAGIRTDWSNLTARIAAAARISFADLIAQRSEEGLYAFVLYTDADCYTVLPSANSRAKFNEKMAKYDVNDPADMAGYRWSIGEWAYEAWQDEAFEPICRELSAASQAACEAGSFTTFRLQVHAAMSEAMAMLDAEGLFGAARDESVLFISSTDYDEAIALENRSAAILNSPGMYEKFLRRYVVDAK